MKKPLNSYDAMCGPNTFCYAAPDWRRYLVANLNFKRDFYRQPTRSPLHHGIKVENRGSLTQYRSFAFIGSLGENIKRITVLIRFLLAVSSDVIMRALKHFLAP